MQRKMPVRARKGLALPSILFSAFIALALVTTMGCPGSSGSSEGAKGPFTVTFDKGNAPAPSTTQLPPAKMTVQSGQKLVLPGRGTLPADAVADPGAYFIGWSKSTKPLTGTETIAQQVTRLAGAPGEALDINADTTLFAVYATTNATATDLATKVAGLTLDKNLGTVTAPATPIDVTAGWPAAYAAKVAPGQKITPYSNVALSRRTFTFNGWALTADAASGAAKPSVTLGAAVPAAGANFTVYANWTKQEVVKITYKVNGGTSGATKASIDGDDYGKLQAQPVLSLAQINALISPDTDDWAAPANKTFVGWTDIAPIGTATTTDGAVKYVAGDTYTGASITLYAKWVDSTTVKTVAYDFNLANSTGGFNTLTAAQLDTLPANGNSYAVGQSITLAAAPVIAPAATATPWKGKFLGWTTVAKIVTPATTWPTGQPYAAGSKQLIATTMSATGVVTFYAQWQEADYGVVGFDANVANAGTGVTLVGTAPGDMKAYVNDSITLPPSTISVGVAPAKQFYAWGDAPTTAVTAVKQPGDSFTVTTKYTTATSKKTFYAVWATIYTVTLDRDNVLTTGANQYPNAPLLSPTFVATTKKFAVGAAAINTTTGEFAAFKTLADTAGYTVTWGIRSTATPPVFTPLTSAQAAAYTPTADVTLYVQFAGKAITVTFNKNDGSTPAVTLPAAAAGKWGEAAGVAIPAGVKTWTKTDLGYAYGGLANAAADTTATAAASAPDVWVAKATDTYAATITLYVFWVGKTYTVSFVGGAGVDASSSQTAITDTIWPAMATLPATTTFTKDGFTFANWQVGSPLADVLDMDTAVTGTQWKPATYTAANTLTAKWVAQKYTVTFSPNGGTGAAVPAASPATDWGTAVTLAAVGTMAKDGYTWGGWSTTATGTALTGATWTPSAPYAAAQTLYAVWTPKTYTVTFNVNGADSGVAAPAVSGATNWGTAVTLATVGTMVKNGYTFVGWSTTTTGTAVAAYTPTGLYASSYTLYAVWTVQTYTVTFNVNGADSGTASVAVSGATNWGSAVTLATVGTMVKNGYTFGGWSTTTTGTAVASFTPTGAYTSSYTLYAVWTVQTYTVTFNVNGADSGTASVAVSGATNWGSAVTLATVGTMVKNGYTFGGWSTTTTGTAVASFTPTGAYTSSYTLYAVWTVKQYTVTFNANGGTGAANPAASAATNWGTAVALAAVGTLARDGYNWGGWSTTTTGTAVATYTPTGTYASSYTLYAVWTAKAYTVTYSVNGGSGTVPTAYSGTWSDTGVATLPAVGSMVGPTGKLVFKGWSATALGTTPLTAPYKPGTWAADTTIYAIWASS